jgi:hypothetical protein
MGFNSGLKVLRSSRLYVLLTGLPTYHRSKHPLASLNFEDAGKKLLEKFSSYLPVSAVLKFPNSWTLKHDHFLPGIICRFSVAYTPHFATYSHSKKAFGFAIRQRFQNCVLAHASLRKKMKDAFRLKEFFRMTVELHLSKPCSRLSMCHPRCVYIYISNIGKK